MSGGHFNFTQFVIKELADEVMLEATSKDFPYDEETKNKFLLAYYYLSKAGVYLNRIDWLLSGDDGEETFHERLKEDLAKLDGGD